MSKYFTPQTDPKLFACSCGACPPGFTVQPSSKLLLMLDEIREALGRAVVISSGVRCPAYNAKVGGVVDSEHTRGEAADLFVVGGLDRFYTMQAALRVGIVRLGIANSFIHVGVGTHEPQHVAWLYGLDEHGASSPATVPVSASSR